MFQRCVYIDMFGFLVYEAISNGESVLCFRDVFTLMCLVFWCMKLSLTENLSYVSEMCLH